jgi:gliding motility-associated lipoprotein GldH
MLSVRAAIKKNPTLIVAIILVKMVVKIILVLLLTGCNDGYRFSKYQDVSVSNWQYKDTLTFELPEIKSTQDLALGIRYTELYKYSNFWLKVIEDGKTSRHSVTLFDKKGYPVGKSLGSHHTVVVALKNINPGKHTIQIVQNMRENPIKGISAVGILIKK